MRLGESLEIGADAVLCAGKTESKERNLAKVRASNDAGTVLDSNFCALWLTARGLISPQGLGSLWPS